MFKTEVLAISVNCNRVDLSYFEENAGGPLENDNGKVRSSDYSGHPWAQLLQASLTEVEPKTLEELEASGGPIVILKRQSSRVGAQQDMLDAFGDWIGNQD